MLRLERRRQRRRQRPGACGHHRPRRQALAGRAPQQPAAAAAAAAAATAMASQALFPPAPGALRRRPGPAPALCACARPRQRGAPRLRPARAPALTHNRARWCFPRRPRCVGGRRKLEGRVGGTASRAAVERRAEATAAPRTVTLAILTHARPRTSEHPEPHALTPTLHLPGARGRRGEAVAGMREFCQLPHRLDYSAVSEWAATSVEGVSGPSKALAECSLRVFMLFFILCI